MANKNPFLAWLLSLGQKDPAEPDSPAPAPVPPAVPPPGSDPESAPMRLDLPQDHAVHKLWSLWAEQSGWQPTPSFSFAGPDGKSFFPNTGSVRQELTRLKLTVTNSANQRLAAIIPKDKGKQGDVPPTPPDLDAQAVVFTVADGMSAWVFVYPPVGSGRELDRDMLSGALAEKQVCFGLDESLANQLPDDPERYFHLFLAARGKEVVHGKDGHIYDLFPRKPERRLTVDEFNRVDYASLSFVQNVNEGDTICRIIPPTRGEAGMTVLGKEIPARDGKTVSAPKGRNTDLTEDGTSLISTKTGHVEFNGRTFQVKPVLEIGGNVDFSTGNINFLGDVHIHGDICTGFTVRAMGSITVDGVVEAGTVEAGEDLIIVKGAQGDNRAVLRASRSVFGKYLESCCVYARENLRADCLINCDVYCDGGVEVLTGRGTIIGGRIRCAHEVNASVVGSRAECRTDVTLGGLPCLEFDQEVLLMEIADLEKELEKTERQPQNPSKFSRMAKLRMQLSLSKNKLDQFRQELEELDDMEEDTGLLRLTCGIAYPGTTVNIGSGSYSFRHETRPVTATLTTDGEIQII